MKQSNQNNLFGFLEEIIQEVSKGSQEAGKTAGNNPFEAALKGFMKMPKEELVKGQEMLRNHSLDNLPMDLIDNQIRIWTELKEKKEAHLKEQESSPLTKLHQLNDELKAMETEIVELNAELPVLLHTDPERASQLLERMAELSKDFSAKKQQFEELRLEYIEKSMVQ